MSSNIDVNYIKKGFINRNKFIFNHALSSVNKPKCKSYVKQKQKAVVLDKLFGNDLVIDFIKIDTEGHELEVLYGLKNTLRNQNPVLLVEIETRHSHQTLKTFLALISLTLTLNPVYCRNL